MPDHPDDVARAAALAGRMAWPPNPRGGWSLVAASTGDSEGIPEVGWQDTSFKIGALQRWPLSTASTMKLSTADSIPVLIGNTMRRVKLGRLPLSTGSGSATWPLTGDDAVEHFVEKITATTEFGLGFTRTVNLRSSAGSTNEKSFVYQNASGFEARAIGVLASTVYGRGFIIGGPSPQLMAKTLGPGGATGDENFFGGQAVQSNVFVQTYKQTESSGTMDVATAVMTGEVGNSFVSSGPFATAQVILFAAAEQGTTKRDSGFLVNATPIYMRQASTLFGGAAPTFRGPASTDNYDQQGAIYMTSTAAGVYKIKAKFKNGTVKTIVSST